MKCSACGVEMGSDVSFCPKCGTKAGAAPTGSMAPSPGQKGPEGGESETKLWSGSFSGKAMIGSWLLAALATVALIVGCFVAPPGIPVFIGLMVFIWLALLGMLAYRKMSIHYDLTTQRFIHQSGILSRNSDRIEMIDIDDVSYTQSLVERMFNVGTIKLTSSDRTHPVLQLVGIDDVKRITDLIDDARRKERRKRGLHIENI